MFKNMPEELEEILKSRDNAQASLAIREFLSQTIPPLPKEVDTESLTTHSEKFYSSLNSERVVDFPTKYYN